MYGPADVTGTAKSDDVVLSVTLTIIGGSNTARLSGKVSSPTKMGGTVTFVLDASSLPAIDPPKWSRERRSDWAGVVSPPCGSREWAHEVLYETPSIDPPMLLASAGILREGVGRDCGLGDYVDQPLKPVLNETGRAQSSCAFRQSGSITFRDIAAPYPHVARFSRAAIGVRCHVQQAPRRGTWHNLARQVHRITVRDRPPASCR